MPYLKIEQRLRLCKSDKLALQDNIQLQIECSHSSLHCKWEPSCCLMYCLFPHSSQKNKINLTTNFKSYKIPSTKLMEQSQGATDTNMHEPCIVLPT